MIERLMNLMNLMKHFRGQTGCSKKKVFFWGFERYQSLIFGS